jgi:16S rRNA (guanine966-N2)-methyltransferase
MSSAKNNKIRLIAGSFRGRKIEVIPGPGLRPTTDRVRETLFNWLQPYIVGARCLDLFAGTGALSFESLSRGAADVWLLDSDTKAVAAINQVIDRLAIDTNTCHAVVANYSASKHLLRLTAFDLVFIDPPFNHNLISPACTYLEENNLLAPNALIYTECELELSPVPVPSSWVLCRQMQTKQSNCCLWRAA